MTEEIRNVTIFATVINIVLIISIRLIIIAIIHEQEDSDIVLEHELFK